MASWCGSSEGIVLFKGNKLECSGVNQGTGGGRASAADSGGPGFGSMSAIIISSCGGIPTGKFIGWSTRNFLSGFVPF